MRSTQRREILLPEGEEAACGEAIAVLADTADEDISAECGGGQSEGGAFADSAEQAAAASPVPEKAAPADIKITPRAKKVAEEQGLEYSHIQGTGLLGAITISDLKKHGIPRKDPASAACSGIGVSPVICIRFVICIRSVICIRPGIWSVNRICPGRSA